MAFFHRYEARQNDAMRTVRLVSFQRAYVIYNITFNTKSQGKAALVAGRLFRKTYI
jgi:hypothetical protein